MTFYIKYPTDLAELGAMLQELALGNRETGAVVGVYDDTSQPITLTFKPTPNDPPQAS